MSTKNDLGNNSRSRGKGRKRWVWIAAVVVLAGVSFGLVGIFGPWGNQQTVLAQAGDSNLVQAFVGDLSDTATATGTVISQQQAGLSLQTSGIVERVLVEVGDQVSASDLLVQLDDDALARSVATAEQNLIIQEANLAELQAGASTEDIASAQAAVDSARSSLENVLDGADAGDIEAARASLTAAQYTYADLLDGPDADSVAQPEANMRNAAAAVKKAQASYDEVAHRPNIAMLPQSLELEQATNNYDAALASYNSAVEGASTDQIEQARASMEQASTNLQKLLDSPTDAELAAAEAQLAQSEASLANLTDGASAEQLAIAQAQVAQARINLEAARDDFAKTSLLAPFDGVVTAVHVAEGEMASGLAVEVVDTNSLEVLLDVDEVDIGELAVGQPAVVTLETWPEVEIPGDIRTIAPQSTNNTSAIVSYEVYLSLGETDLPVRVGMTANADLITASKSNALLVPSQAITSDRDAGRYFVNLASFDANGALQTRQVEVTVGLKDNDNTEITGGINAGDQLTVNSISASTGADAAQPGFAPPIGGGMGR